MINLIRFRLTIYLSVIAITFSIAQPNQFRSSGIGGGSALFYPSISPHNNNIIYAASDVSSMFYTNDGGESWDIIPSNQLVATTESKVHFTADPNILYTVCRDFIADKDYPCKSIDAGSTWQRLDHPAFDGEVEYLFADPNRTDRLIVTTYEVMFCSEDGGATFERRYEAETDAGLHIGGVFWDNADIYVGSTDGLLVSNDGGGSFAKKAVDGLPNSFGFLSFSGAKKGNDLRFFSVARNKFSFYPGIWGSDYWEEESAFFCVEPKGGAEFKTLPGFDFTQSNFPFYVASSNTDIETIYVAGAEASGSIFPGVWKSTDGGMTWEASLEPRGNATVETGYMGDGGVLTWHWSENAMGFAVSPTDPNMAVITDFSFLHVTKDAGKSWQATYVKPEERNPSGALTPKSATYSSNGLENTSVWNLHWSSPNQVFACFTDLTGFISTDGGEHWSLDYNGLDYFDEDDSSQKYNTIYHISEHPQNHTMYAAASTLHDIYQTHVLTDNEVIGRGEIGAIWSSTNGGKDWSLIREFDVPIIQTAIDPIDPNILYATAAHPTKGGIFKITNLSAGRAATWQKLPNPTDTRGRANTVHVLKDRSVVSTFSGGQTNEDVFTSTSGVFYSQNGGQSWEDKSAPQMKYYTKGLTIDPHDENQNTWYVGVWDGWPTGTPSVNLGGLYRTSDRGDNWEELGDFYRVESTTVHPKDHNIMYVATESEGLWYTDNLETANPSFIQVESYPFLHPTRVVFNPFDSTDVWVTSFGNGIRRGKEEMTISTKDNLVPEYNVVATPNPGNLFINIQLPDELVNTNREFQLAIYDLSGKQLVSERFSGSVYTLNKSLTGSGIFVYQVKEAGRRLAIGKLVFN